MNNSPRVPPQATEAIVVEDPLASTLINTVHLRRFEPDTTRSYTDIPVPQDIHLDKLLHALHQVGENFNQENALRVHADTQDWVKEITQEMNLPEDKHYAMSLKGGFGEIELDLAQLEPQRIQAFFANLLAGLNAEDLRQNHQRLGDHVLISSGFSGLSPASEADQKAQELIAIANALAQALELAPSPDSPDILSLLRSFLDILRQLDIDLGALHKLQAAQMQQAKQISDAFAEQLQNRLLQLQQHSANSQHPEWDVFKTLKLS